MTNHETGADMKATPDNWTRSTGCSDASCVEVGHDNGEYLVRDSKNPDVPPLRFTAAEWAAFVEGVQAGEFRF